MSGKSICENVHTPFNLLARLGLMLGLGIGFRVRVSESCLVMLNGAHSVHSAVCQINGAECTGLLYN